MTFLVSNLLNEGGPLFMYTNLVLLIVCIALIILVLLKGDATGKITELIKHISLFSLVWGFLGLFIGLISAFDSISMTSDVSSGVLADGLKIGLLAPTFGIFIFAAARLGIIILTLKKK